MLKLLRNVLNFFWVGNAPMVRACCRRRSSWF